MGSLNWSVVLQNANPRVAFRDFLYITTYRDAQGQPIDERHELIRDILQPGATRVAIREYGPGSTIGESMIAIPLTASTAP